MKLDWKPIETAPTDPGSRIMVWTPSVGIDCPSWFNHDRYAKRPRPYWDTLRANTRGILWLRNNQPTHWCEIPEGPQ